jgi:hypothetical protein
MPPEKPKQAGKHAPPNTSARRTRMAEMQINKPKGKGNVQHR